VPELVVSPDAVARFVRGGARLHNAHVAQGPITTRDPAVIEVLLQFVEPQDPGALRARVAEPHRQGYDQLIDTLARAGILVAAATADARGSQAGDRMAHVRRQLGLLATAAAELAGDVAALGPHALGPLDAGVPLEHRLESIVAALGSLREHLGEARRIQLAQQLEELRRAGLLDDPKLHLGAGARRLEGWINVDVHPAPLSLNLTRGLPFADSSVRVIFASHLFEHLYYPNQALRFLAECRRVLRPGGRLRLVVPDIERYIRAYAAGDDAFFTERRRTWQGLPEGRTHLEEFLSYAGAGPDPATFLDSHKYAYDYATLARLLARAGFVDVARSTYMGSDLPDLRVDEASEVAGATSEGRHYSLFVEATAPPAGPAAAAPQP
jgi:SAM-dependent methyltransferase